MTIQGTTTIEGTLYWPWLRTYNPKFGATKYEVDIGNLDKAAIKSLKDIGLEVKDKGTEMGSFIKAKTKFHVSVTDEDGEEVDAQKVGNGTKAKIEVFAYDSKAFPGKLYNGLSDIVVTELVVYGGNSDGDAPLDASNEDLEEAFS